MVDMAEDAVQKEVKAGSPERPRIVDKTLHQVARLVGDRAPVRPDVLYPEVKLRTEQKKGTAKKRKRKA